MSNATLIIGPSGSGKSTSMRNLDPKTTFVLGVLDKPLPFRGYKKHYIPLKGWDDKSGNYYASDDWIKLVKCIHVINDIRPEIKTLCLDDMQYLMANEFLRRATETGFSKFTELAQHLVAVINALTSTREDLLCFVMCHNEVDMNGRYKCKTIGKLLDEKITLEGLFTTIFHSMVVDGQFKFLTQNDGTHIAKSPMGLCADLLIDNDLEVIRKAMINYYNEDGE